MTIPDLLLLLLLLACIAYFFAKKRRKKISNTANSDLLQVGTLKGSGCNFQEFQPLNYLSLRQSESTALHGVSVYSFKLVDDTLSDTDVETSVSSAVVALVKDGFKPHVNAVSSGCSLVFYITY
jgi:hypothetical protein